VNDCLVLVHEVALSGRERIAVFGRMETNRCVAECGVFILQISATSRSRICLVGHTYDLIWFFLVPSVSCLATVMHLKVRDWVRITDHKIGRITSINVQAMVASIDALDDSQNRVIVVTLPLEGLVPFDAAKYLPERLN
jgi:hypothetical protein